MTQRASAPGWTDKARRAVWSTAWWLLFRPSPRPLFGWRRLLLRVFGAEIGRGANVYPSCRIWAPWNLVMRDGSCLAFRVECYSVDKISIGEGATISQDAHLCTAGHDIRDPAFALVSSPIEVGAEAWIAAGAYVGPGVRIGDRAVVAARAVVVRDVAAGQVVGGNPARVIGRRDEAPGSGAGE